MENTFVLTGIGTEVGKTVCSAVLVKVLAADYWKPVQSGDLHATDTMKVARWNGIELPSERFHPERWRLRTPMSPHAAADIDGVRIEAADFGLPKTTNPLLIEGAGGLFVPLNEQLTLLDVFAQWQLPTILVSYNYLGSINHTLLSIAQLRQRNIPIAGIIFNGPATPTTESVIEQMTGVPVLFRMPVLAEVNAQTITSTATQIQTELRSNLTAYLS
ncbi:MAG: dethiobiotin synthase [Bacteroidota bacterium]